MVLVTCWVRLLYSHTQPMGGAVLSCFTHQGLRHGELSDPAEDARLASGRAAVQTGLSRAHFTVEEQGGWMRHSP